MPIDTFSETVLTLTQAAKSLPRRRAGKACDVATLYRWSQQGCRGVRLETIQIGGTRCTSEEALQRFFDALTVQTRHALPTPAPQSRARQRAISQAEAVLDAAGI